MKLDLNEKVARYKHHKKQEGGLDALIREKRDNLQLMVHSAAPPLEKENDFRI